MPDGVRAKMPTFCPDCRKLLESAQAATQRHIATMARQQVAAIRYEHELAHALEIAAAEAREARQKAVEAYRLHCMSHRMTEFGIGA